MPKCQNCIITYIFYAYFKSLQNEFMTRNSLKCDLARARLCNGRMSSSGRIDRGESQANRICLITLSDFWGTESSFDQGSPHYTFVLQRSSRLDGETSQSLMFVVAMGLVFAAQMYSAALQL